MNPRLLCFDLVINRLKRFFDQLMGTAQALMKKPNRETREFGMSMYYHCFCSGETASRKVIISHHITHIGSGDVSNCPILNTTDPL